LVGARASLGTGGGGLGTRDGVSKMGGERDWAQPGEQSKRAWCATWLCFALRRRHSLIARPGQAQDQSRATGSRRCSRQWLIRTRAADGRGGEGETGRGRMRETGGRRGERETIEGVRDLGGLLDATGRPTTRQSLFDFDDIWTIFGPHWTLPKPIGAAKVQQPHLFIIHLETLNQLTWPRFSSLLCEGAMDGDHIGSRSATEDSPARGQQHCRVDGSDRVQPCRRRRQPYLIPSHSQRHRRRHFKRFALGSPRQQSAPKVDDGICMAWRHALYLSAGLGGSYCF